MIPVLPGRLVATLLVAGTLAGCVDAAVEVELTGPGAARAVVTQTMGADFYAMLTAEDGEDGEDGEEALRRFCSDGKLTENRDRSATCTIVVEGNMRQLRHTEDQPIRFTPEQDGLVRIELALDDVRDRIGAGETDDEGRRMLEAFFSGRKLTVSFSGAAIAETNMEVSADGDTASAVLPLLDIVNETGKWPDVLYAVVEAP